ncbi:MAG: DNA repair protein RadC [Acidobacteria bacterium]|nr:MAG: DNA repair protein RadC [Acidobacteriota bacterium]
MRLRELRISYQPVAGASPGPRPRLTSPSAAVRQIAPLLEPEAVEVFGALLLNTKHEPICWHVVSRGCLDATLVHPREVIKAACLANAAALVVAHNHPSGDPEPSREDVVLTLRLRQALELVGIELLDSLVIGDGGRYVSLQERGRSDESGYLRSGVNT